MEPNGYPSEDPTSFGCRKLLGPDDQKMKDGKQKVMGEDEQGEEEQGRSSDDNKRRRRRTTTTTKMKKRSGGSVLEEY